MQKSKKSERNFQAAGRKCKKKEVNTYFSNNLICSYRGVGYIKKMCNTYNLKKIAAQRIPHTTY
jgi:hypothetical protein